MDAQVGNNGKSYGSLWHTEKLKRSPRKPSTLAVHGALVSVFVLFGGGSFVSKFGIRGASPLLFELVREAVVGPFFLIVCRALNGRSLPEIGDVPRVATIGLFFAMAQACFFMGLKHENPTVGSTWQAALPIFTTLLAVWLGQEKTSCMRAAGVALASGGAMWMTVSALFTAKGSAIGGGKNWLDRIDGHALFFGQCIFNSLQIVMGKPIASKYGGIGLSAWMFMGGTFFMLAFVLIVRSSWGLSEFVCEDPDVNILRSCAEAILQIPSSMIWPLVYEVVLCSFLAWWQLSWALQHAPASVVSVYSVVQPCTTCILSLMAVGLKGKTWAETYGITVPGVHNILGGLLIAAGLWVMFAEESSENVSREDEEERLTNEYDARQQ